MPVRSTRPAVVLTTLLLCVSPILAQNSPDTPPRYTLRVAVDEVEVTFHATGLNGLSVNDLKADEVKVLDNWKPPRRVVSFEALIDRPIRAALLLDTSTSMDQALAAGKQLAQGFAAHVFRQASDQAMVMDFGYSSEIMQNWSADSSTLSHSIQQVRIGRLNPMPGTAILDSIFRACFYGFAKADPSATANFILLFSDGENNAGQISLDDALRACQHSNTVIYAFQFPAGTGYASTGPKLLHALATATGGQVFRVDRTPQELSDDLKIIESDARNQYRLVYNPAQFAHDGAFHSIGLEMPDRVDKVNVRSGYYAPKR